MSFCLIEVEAEDRVGVFFERGAARSLPGEPSWPANTAPRFLALDRPTWASEAVEGGVRNILARSELVKRWRAHVDTGASVCGAAVDAPCGFAAPGRAARDTEEHVATSFRTADADTFVRTMRAFAEAGKDTPLQQRYLWKIVGLIAFRDLLATARVLPFDADVASIAAACTAGLTNKPQPDGSVGLEPVVEGAVRVREAFPSDTYARANGSRGVLAPASRAILARIAEAPWDFVGNKVGMALSRPTKNMCENLLTHRRALRRDLAASGPIAAMHKIPRDPSWADLWDAFACAFVSMCEAHGAVTFAGSLPACLRTEGVIVVPVSILRISPIVNARFAAS